MNAVTDLFFAAFHCHYHKVEVISVTLVCCGHCPSQDIGLSLAVQVMEDEHSLTDRHCWIKSCDILTTEGVQIAFYLVTVL